MARQGVDGAQPRLRVRKMTGPTMAGQYVQPLVLGADLVGVLDLHMTPSSSKPTAWALLTLPKRSTVDFPKSRTFGFAEIAGAGSVLPYARHLHARAKGLCPSACRTKYCKNWNHKAHLQGDLVPVELAAHTQDAIRLA